jgi:hypothetical protein
MAAYRYLENGVMHETYSIFIHEKLINENASVKFLVEALAAAVEYRAICPIEGQCSYLCIHYPPSGPYHSHYVR